MKLKHFLILIALVTAVGAIYSIYSQITPKPLRSFLVTEVLSSPKQGSPYLTTWTSARAVREDGSWVAISMGTFPLENERDIRDFKTGVYTIVDDTTQSIVRESIPPDEYKHRLAPAVSCKGTPAGQILGQAVNYNEETTQITQEGHGDATSVVKTWLAPDLGCFVLQKHTIWTRNGDGVLLTDTKITPIAISFQPVDEFFDVPPSYVERTKEEVSKLFDERAIAAHNLLNQLAATPRTRTNSGSTGK